MILPELASRLSEAGLLSSSHETVPGLEITTVADDSRAVSPGALFVAIKGTAADGHAYARDAAARGAVAIVAQQPVDVDVPVLTVQNSRQAAALAAAWKWGDPARRLKLVAVTGTNGKSTVVGMVRHLLSMGASVGSLGTLGGFDAQGEPLYREGLTTPGPVALHASLANLVERGCDTVVLEASSHALEQDRLFGLSFQAGVFTNISHDHLDYHPTFEAYRQAKMSLTTLITDGGAQVVNKEERMWDDLPLGSTQRRLTFGHGGDLHVEAGTLTADENGSTGRMVFGPATVPFRIPHLGAFNVSNALAAVGTGLSLGYDLNDLVERLREAPQVPGRMERITPSPLVIRDYAHTPDALERAIAAARPLARNRLIVLFGCGGDRDREKRAPMGRIAVRDADLAIATSDNPRTEDPDAILDDIAEGIEGHAYLRIVDRREAIERGIAMMKDGDCLLLAGKGHETYQVLGTERVPFDEREIVMSIVGVAQ